MCVCVCVSVSVMGQGAESSGAGHRHEAIRRSLYGTLHWLQSLLLIFST